MNIYHQARCDLRYRMVLLATLSLILNLFYAIYHGVLSIQGQSWWMLALCAYYTILGMTRFAAVLCEHKHTGTPDPDMEFFVMKVCGMLLIALACVLASVQYFSMKENNITRYGTIPMITIATYTFTKLTMAIIRSIRHGHDPSPLLAAIRRTGYAEALVSILTLQRSMLVSFGEMPASETQMLNALTGAGVYVMVTILGSIMIRESREKRMSKSKIVKAYEKIEETVVGSYQKVENAVVGSYTKLENAFVDRYLTKDGETVEEAKARLKEEADSKS